MLQRIWTRKRIYIVILVYLIFGSYSYLQVLYNGEIATFFESTMLSSIETRTMAGVYMMVIFPLVSTYLLSDIFLEDESLKIKYLWYTKYGVFKYHSINLLNIFVVVFIVTFACFGFNILLSYISFGKLNVSNTSVFTDYKLEDYSDGITHFSLLLKSPLLFFLVKNTYISLYGSLFAMFSYLISIFIKNKYIIILLPTLIYNIIGLVTSVLGRPGYSLYNLLYPNFSVVIRIPELINIYAIILLLINFLMFVIVILRERDNV